MLKCIELRDPKSCLNKAESSEVVFVLRAKDPLAAQTIRLWAAMADGVHEGWKIAEALRCAKSMETQYKQYVALPRGIAPRKTTHEDPDFSTAE